MHWVPLESNPELFTTWASELGLISEQFQYYDVFGMDDMLLDMIPQPVEALLLLFPITKEVEELRIQEDAEKEEESAPGTTNGLIWFKQTIGNACGSIGLLHSLANSAVRSAIKPDSALAKLFERAIPLSPQARASLLSESEELETAHSETAQAGQSVAPGAEDDVNLHFVCFVRNPATGTLVELDGRRKGIVQRQVTVETQHDLLKRATKFVQEHYMKRNPTELHFNLIALAPNVNT